jgi:hypothetical protein
MITLTVRVGKSCAAAIAQTASQTVATMIAPANSRRTAPSIGKSSMT